jgi:ACS family hexuronate transporter-like MFS transporter
MKVKGLRWWVLFMVVMITIINYLDRGTLNYMWIANTRINYPLANANAAMAKPFAIQQPDGSLELYEKDGSVIKVEAAAGVLKEKDGSPSFEYLRKGGIAYELGLIDINQPADVVAKRSKELLAYITMFFMVAYGISQLVSGKLYDKIGTRRGFVMSVVIWGCADMLTSFARGIASLSFFRVLLGLGEAGPWPGAVKSNAEWFPVKQRAFAQGLFGAGGSLGSVMAPVIISMLYINFGWKSTFVIVGSLGLVWIIPWLIINKATPAQHPWIKTEEKDFILSGQPNAGNTVQDEGKSWGQLLKTKSSYAVILGRFFLDPIWWMFVTWLPVYLSEVFKLDIKQIAYSAWVPYAGAAVGAIVGGWFSGFLMKKGHTVNKARKTAIVIGACIILPAMIAAAYATSANKAVLLMALILGGFQFTIVNIQTLPGDFHTGKTIGSLAGLGGAAAVAGTVITMLLVPQITSTSWLWFFVMGALLVPLSIAAVFFFAGDISKRKTS